MNYDQLVDLIKSYSNRTDDQFTRQIDNFITQAIYRIYSDARTIGFQKIQIGNFVANGSFITKPPDWKETISLSYVNNVPEPTTIYLLPRSYEFCNSYAPHPLDGGDPVFYADYSLPTPGLGRIFLAPTPTTNSRYELIYLSIPSFNSQVQVEFIAARYPALILYASLLEAAPFLKDDERVAMFEARYNKELANVQKDTTSRYTDRLSRRDKD